VYQAVPYAGMGKVFDFIHVTNDVLSERGVQLPLSGQAATTAATRAEQGRAIQERIVGADRVERMYGCDPQVRGHVAASLNVGNDRQTLISVLTALLPFIGYPRTLNALAAINEVAPASQQG
jgi:4-carboxymuconolactone decarboxylase